MLAILLFVLLHDICLIWAGFTIASIYLNVDGSGSNARVNQALEVYGDPVRGNLVNFASQRYRTVSAYHPLHVGMSHIQQRKLCNVDVAVPIIQQELGLLWSSGNLKYPELDVSSDMLPRTALCELPSNCNQI